MFFRQHGSLVFGTAMQLAPLEPYLADPMSIFSDSQLMRGVARTLFVCAIDDVSDDLLRQADSLERLILGHMPEILEDPAIMQKILTLYLRVPGVDEDVNPFRHLAREWVEGDVCRLAKYLRGIVKAVASLPRPRYYREAYENPVVLAARDEICWFHGFNLLDNLELDEPCPAMIELYEQALINTGFQDLLHDLHTIVQIGEYELKPTDGQEIHQKVLFFNAVSPLFYMGWEATFADTCFQAHSEFSALKSLFIRRWDWLFKDCANQLWWDIFSAGPVYGFKEGEEHPFYVDGFVGLFGEECYIFKSGLRAPAINVVRCRKSRSCPGDYFYDPVILDPEAMDIVVFSEVQKYEQDQNIALYSMMLLLYLAAYHRIICGTLSPEPVGIPLLFDSDDLYRLARY